LNPDSQFLERSFTLSESRMSSSSILPEVHSVIFFTRFCSAGILNVSMSFLFLHNITAEEYGHTHRLLGSIRPHRGPLFGKVIP